MDTINYISTKYLLIILIKSQLLIECFFYIKLLPKKSFFLITIFSSLLSISFINFSITFSDFYNLFYFHFYFKHKLPLNFLTVFSLFVNKIELFSK